MYEFCEPAPAADEIKATYANGRLTIVARGTTPEACWDVVVTRSPVDIWPPEFIVVACRASGICAQVITPYVARAHFEFGRPPREITVHDAAGSHTVSVVTAGPSDAAAPPGGYGTSLSLSLPEAITTAAQHVPPGPGNVGRSVRVTEIWYTDGGIVGPALHVRVQDMSRDAG